jgi:hypothetical protein
MHPSIEAAVGMTAAAALPVAAVAVATGDPGVLSVLSVSAGLSGAVVATLKMHLNQSGDGGTPQPRWHWLSTVISGAAAAVFAGPAIASAVGMNQLPPVMLTHFVTGLLGSSLCDVVLLNQKQIIAWAAKRFGLDAKADK